MTTESERREFMRLPLEAEVSMMVRYGHGGEFYFGTCRNLSPGGLFIATKTPAPYGSEVTLKFTLPGSDQPLSAAGTVVRVHREIRNRRASGPTGMHIHFSTVEDEVEDEIRTFVSPRIRQLVIRALAERRRTSVSRTANA